MPLIADPDITGQTIDNTLGEGFLEMANNKFTEMSDKTGLREVVVITGGTAGIGRATARYFARHGASIALLARGKDRLDDTVKELAALGAKATGIITDVANSDEVEAAANMVEEKLGPIDIWINNAMVSVFSPFKDMTPEEFKRVTEVNYLGTVYGTFAALKRMLPRKRGTIVQVGSALAYRSIPLQSAYCGSKHAIRGFTDSIRSELLHDKSRVFLTMVQLPAHNTPQFSWVKSRLPNRAQPVPPIFQPEVAAQAIYWAAHHRRRELHVGFPAVKAIWGNKFIPGLIDRYLALTGYKGQQTGTTRDPDTPDNLWTAAPGHQAAHGRFDSRAKVASWQLGFTTNRSMIFGLLLGSLALRSWLQLRMRRS